MTERLKFAVKSFRSRPPLTALAVAVVLSLSACGGGGGGGGGAGGIGPTSLGLGSGAEVSMQRQRAAGNDPVPGSVTQGSRASGEVTADTVQYQGGSIVADGVGTLAPASVSIPELPGAQVFMHERAIAVAVSGFDGQDEPQYANTDPLLFGFWAYEVTPDNIIWGAFADGLSVSKTPAATITAATGSATYQGKTLAAYENIGGQGDSGMATADVNLLVQFGGSPTVGGTIDNLIDISNNMGVPGQILLGAASIDRTVDGGFFKGETSGPDNVRGKWGGQFFGSEYQYIGGTWGASFRDEDGVFSAAGAFSATKQPPTE